MELLEVYANYNTFLSRLQHLLHLPQRAGVSRRDTRRKQVQNWLTSDQQAELISRYLAGDTAHQLAETFRVHRTTVAKLLVDAGIRRPRSLTPEQVQEAIRLYADGWSCEHIGQHFGRDHSTIWLALKRADVKLRDTHGRGR